jgi:hypothetical protein
MLPYDGTPIKDTLEAAGRLKGDVCAPEYDFLDPKLDAFYADLARVVEVTGWVHGPRALTMQLSWAHVEVAIIRRLFPALPDTDAYESALKAHTARSNAQLFEIVERLADLHERGVGEGPDPSSLRELCDETLAAVIRERDAFIARNQDVLLEALEAAA